MLMGSRVHILNAAPVAGLLFIHWVRYVAGIDVGIREQLDCNNVCQRASIPMHWNEP
jgi:hypothetical protein